MADGRNYLPVGTTVELNRGNIYRITGAPVGCGGGSILYPARRQYPEQNGLRLDEIPCVLKECYPVCMGYSFRRDSRGEICPAGEEEAENHYLRQARLRQLEEGQVSRRIYQTASRVLPIREASSRVTLTLPGGTAAAVENTFTVMDSLEEKGRCLTQWMRQKRRFGPLEAFRILQQLLFALREVHQAGYLHLDIQDGNVFLRGTLEDKDELVTLIDFGCAREMTDGKTAPVRDRMIFTTQGFSAPEILLHNDGNLQLGPEADIFSVGCLALYLLTGQRANVRELMENRTGVFLRPNQLRRIRCPRHLEDTMQEILARALAKEAKNRYPSADAMLTDISELVDALQPYRTDLSGVKYDAFVCYKHGDIDSAAALTLQRSLENYRAPRGVGSSRRPFRRVFVDEGELASCADFGRQIREALKNSGWLIVICSPDTPLSPWVQLEIDTFLEYHDRSRILAVLTGGSPATSFPSQLKAGPDGTGEVFAAHAISDTAREAEKKLKGDALLKIAAPLLETTYDTLKQRQKIYRLQRLAAVTAVFALVAVGFLAFAANRAAVIAAQAQRIQEEYGNALRSESRFLTEQANKRLEADDPLGAMELALQALPSEQQERPALAEAEYVLGKALGIYIAPGDAKNTISAVGMVPTACEAFCLNADGTRLLAWEDWTMDGAGLLECWDTETLRLLWTYEEYDLIRKKPLMCGEDLLTMGYDAVHCIDSASGEKKWTTPLENCKESFLSRDGRELMVLSTNGNDGLGSDTETHLEILVTVLDSRTGKTLRNHSFRIAGGYRVDGETCVSADFRYLAVPTSNVSALETIWYSYNSLHLLDLQTGECRMILDSRTNIAAMHFAGDRLAVLRAEGWTMTTIQNVEYRYDEPYTFRMESYRIPDGNLLWSRELTDYMEAGGQDRILEIPYDTGEASGMGLLYVFNDHCTLLDRDSGEILRQYVLSDSAAKVTPTENGFTTINLDGSITIQDFSRQTMLSIPGFGGGISAVENSGGAFYVQKTTMRNDDCTIFQYRGNWYDEAYTQEYEADGITWRILGEKMLNGSAKVILTKENQVCLVDLETGNVLTRTLDPAYGFSEYSVLGTGSGGNYLYWTDSAHLDNPEAWGTPARMFVLDFHSGSVTQITRPTLPHGFSIGEDTLYTDSAVLMAETWMQDTQEWLSIYAWEPLTGKNEELYRCALAPAPEEGDYNWETYLRQSMTFDRESGWINFLLGENRTGVLTRMVGMNLFSGQTREIPLEHSPCQGQDSYGYWQDGSYRWNREGTRLAIAYGGQMVILDQTGGELCRTPVAEDVRSLYFTPEETALLAVDSDGTLCRYSVQTGECLGNLELQEESGVTDLFITDQWLWTALDDTTLLLSSARAGFKLDISGDSVKLKAVIGRCIGYLEQTDRFYVSQTGAYSGNGVSIGSFPNYTLEALIQKAQTILNRG